MPAKYRTKKGDKVRARIILALSTSDLTFSQLAIAAEMNTGQMYYHLEKLLDSGVVHRGKLHYDDERCCQTVYHLIKKEVK